MNWNKVISYGSGVIATVAFAVVCINACSDRNKDIENLKKANETIKSASEAVEKSRKIIKILDEENEALRDSVTMWRDSTAIYRDSTAFYKDAWQDCEKGKRCVRKTTPVKTKPAPITTPKPVRPAEPKKENCSNNDNVTKIDVRDNSVNNGNIIVSNDNNGNSNTEITLGSGAVNEGNIVVNNGGNVTINGDNNRAIDSLRNVVDSLKQNTAKGNYAAASSVVVLRKVKTYRRTR